MSSDVAIVQGFATALTTVAEVVGWATAAVGVYTGASQFKELMKRDEEGELLRLSNEVFALQAAARESGSQASPADMGLHQAGRALVSYLETRRLCFDDDHISAIRVAMARVLTETDDRAAAWFWWERLGTLNNMEVRTIRLLDDLTSDGVTPAVFAYQRHVRILNVAPKAGQASLVLSAMPAEHKLAIAEATVHSQPHWWTEPHGIGSNAVKGLTGVPMTQQQAFMLSASGRRVAKLIRPIAREARLPA